MKVVAKSDIGKVRESNQDSFFITENSIGFLPNLFIIADGMGGYSGGDVASKYVIDEIINFISKLDEKKQNIHSTMYSLITHVDKNLSKIASSSKKYNGMGSTLLLASIINNKLMIENVGDSRLYLMMDELRQITYDHSVVMELVANGIITKDEAKAHPEKNMITRAMGYGAYPDSYDIAVKKGDIILMCTDGLSNMLSDTKIEEILKMNCNLEEKLNMLVNSANEKGGLDNITVILIEIDEELC